MIVRHLNLYGLKVRKQIRLKKAYNKVYKNGSDQIINIEQQLRQLNMQPKRNKSDQQQPIVDSLELLFYPQYPPNAPASQFLSNHEPLFQQLRKLDQATQQQIKKLHIFSRHSSQNVTERVDDIQKMISFIVQELNNLCTYCHRKQLRVKISQQLSKYKNNLKNVPIGKSPIIISNWQDTFYSKPSLQSIEQAKRKLVLTILDKIYIQHRRIPHYYLLLLEFPEILINLYNFEEKIIFDSKCEKTSMPLVHKYFLGVIAAATYGNRYFWNFMVEKFIKYGGDVKWIQNGLEQIPQYLKKFSQICYQMAYHFKINILEDLCFDIGKIIEDSSILEGFYVLSYFQFLSSVTLVFGLIPQSIQFQKYLPSVPSIKPSFQSFQTMKKVSKKELKYENQIARQFQQMYCWQRDSEKENMKRVQFQIMQKKCSQSRKFTKSASSNLLQGLQSSQRTQQTKQLQNKLMVTFEEQQIIRKIKGSKTMKNIQNLYGKYVQFDKRRSLIEFKGKADKKVKTHKSIKGQNLETNPPNSSDEEYDFIYASEWSFEENVSNLMESTISHTFHTTVCELLKSLKFVDKKKSKKLKMYYESLQNYMYEYTSYVKLINQGLSLVQKNYVKLLTRSPFLFNEKSFLKMKQDLEQTCETYHPFRFALQIFSFKLEHSLSLGSYAYYRYIENK